MSTYIEECVTRLIKISEAVRLAPQRRSSYQRILAEVEENEPALKPLALLRTR